MDTFASTVTLSQDIINFQEFDQIGINKIIERATHQTVEDTKRTLELSPRHPGRHGRHGRAHGGDQPRRPQGRARAARADAEEGCCGAATGLDIVRAQQNAANARASLVAGDEALRQAREALGLALGIPEETGVSPALRVDGFASDALRACHAVADVDERPDIAAARTNLEVAKRNLRNTWFSFLPTLGGSAPMSVTSVPPQGYPNPTISIGAVLTVPIWDGGRASAT